MFGSSGDEGSSGSEGCEDMPPLIPAEPNECYLNTAERARAECPMPSYNYGGHSWWRCPFEVLSPFEVMLSRLAENSAYGRVGLVTADSPTDNHVAAAPELQAMEDSAASSNEEPGSASARQLFLRHFPSTTSDTQGRAWPGAVYSAGHSRL